MTDQLPTNIMSEQGTTKDQLKPCPFCGAGETLVEPDSKHWAGMSWNILSWQVRHWCAEPAKGVRGSMVIIRAKTEPEVIDKWNQRA